MPDDSPDTANNDLRLRAEEQLATHRLPSPIEGLDARRALHELQVHQVELQLQNEALREAETTTEEALRRLGDLHLSMEEKIVQRTAQLTAAMDALELQIRQRSAVEDELRMERSALERRVLERTRDLEQATAEACGARSVAEEASLQKNHFLAKVSHELRTPLQALLGWAQVLQQRGITPELVSRAADRIIHNVGLQARMIDDLLDISRILSGDLLLDFQEVVALDVIEHATGVVRNAGQGNGITIDLVSHVDHDARLWTDATRLEQVIWNLLSNAVHASSAGGRVQLSVDIDQGNLYLSVKDWGAGIDEADLECVFEPFRKGAGTGSRHGGMGLGLSIVRHIVTLFAGKIEVRSTGPGHGAEFLVQLPLHQGKGLETTVRGDVGNTEKSARLVGMKILYVEDEADIAESCALLLSGLGVEIETCLTFDQARHLVIRGDFDILLTDMRLDADHTGTELLRALRQTPHGRTMPALVLSANGSEADRQASLDAGFAGHLVKPLNANKVLEALLAELSGR